MASLFTHLLLASLGLALFYLLYHLLLRRLTFYGLNRLFLLLGLIFSLVYPFFNLGFLQIGPDFSTAIAISFPLEALQNTATPSQIQPDNSSRLLILSAYWSLCGLMFLRMLLRLYSLYRLHHETQLCFSGKFSYRKHNKAVSPFSFWNTVYLNPGQLAEEELQTVLKHEQVHVQQWHSLDMLLAELGIILLWFNPFIWLYQRSISANLEYFTDQELLEQGINQKTYQYSLLKFSNMPQGSALANNFNFSTLKNRIAMMKKSKSARPAGLQYLLVLPMVASLLCLSTLLQAQSSPQGVQIRSTRVVNENPLYIIDGKEATEQDLKQMKPEDIESVDVLKGESAIAVFGDKAKAGAVIIITKMNADTEAVKVLKQRIRKQPANETSGSENAGDAKNNINVILDGKKVDFAEMYLIIDGKEATAAEVNALSSDIISHMEVVKGPDAVNIWGEKAKKGAVLITTKK